MFFQTTELNGLYLIKPKIFKDVRGSFIKTFHLDTFKEYGVREQFTESYYSVSKKNVLRGMHFQIPPHEHTKLVYATSGAALDIVLDLRKNMPTYGHHLKFSLTAENGYILLIPKGCAHGFLALEDRTCMTYMQTTIYAQNSDCGIRYDSFGADWGKEEFIISDRDRSFPSLKEFMSPFR